MLRYSVLRLLIFFGCLGLLWLLGLRDRDEQVLLVIGAALLSLAISWVVLKPFREDYSRAVAERLEARKAGRGGVGDRRDEAAEDAEVSGWADEETNGEPGGDDFR